MPRQHKAFLPPGHTECPVVPAAVIRLAEPRPEDIVDATELYLRIVCELEEEQEVALRARLRERIGHAGPTVTQMVGRLERDGLLVSNADRVVQLTEPGRRIGMAVLRKHRLAERMLHDLLGIAWTDLHREANRLQHVLSDDTERGLLALLAPPWLDPYGNPIAGLEDLGVPGSDTTDEKPPRAAFTEARRTLADAALVFRRGWVGAVRIRALGERVQNDPELLATLAAHGITPGRQLHVTAGPGGVYCWDDPEAWASTDHGAAALVERDLSRHIQIAHRGQEGDSTTWRPRSTAVAPRPGR